MAPLVKELDANRDLWDLYNFRTRMYSNSPHQHVHDIWLRYRDYSEFDQDDPALFCNDPAADYSYWYCAAFILERTREMIHKIVDTQKIDELGGCLITMIPPYNNVLRHADNGYHAEYYKDKYLLLLRSTPDQTFCFEDETHSGEAGDLFHFNNQAEHWVRNPTDVARISLLIAGRNND